MISSEISCHRLGCKEDISKICWIIHRCENDSSSFTLDISKEIQAIVIVGLLSDNNDIQFSIIINITLEF